MIVKREVVPIPPRKTSGGMYVIKEAVGGKTDAQTITERSLFQQRHYGVDELGQWTRPLGGGSCNSLQ